MDRVFEQRSSWTPNVLASIVIAVSSLALVGWGLEIDRLIRIAPGLASMKPNTALGFILAGISIIALNAAKGSADRLAKARFISMLLSGICVAIGTITLAEHLFSVDLFIDRILFPNAVLQESLVVPGRMAPATAICLIMIGTSLIILKFRSQNLFIIGELLNIATVLIGLLSVIDYAYDVRTLYAISIFSTVSIQTAIVLVLTAISVIFTYGPGGINTVFWNRSIAGVVARRLIPFAILFPIIVGWLRIEGQQLGYYQSEFGTALFTVTNVVALSVMLWLTARSIESVDRLRLVSDESLRASIRELEDLKFAIDESAIVAVTDDKGRITKVNRAFCNISGYTEEELIGQDHRIINSKYHPTEFIESLWTTIKAGEVWRGEIKNQRKDGSHYWVDTTIVPFLADSGAPIQYIAIRHDISLRRELADLAFQQKMLLIRQSFEPIFIWDLDEGISEWNAGCERLYGFTQNEAKGKMAYQILRSQYPIPIPDYLRILRDNGQWTSEVKQFTKTGRELLVESRQQIIRVGDRSIVVTTNRDITASRQAERQLRESEERYRNLFDNNPFPMWVYDTDNLRFLAVNSAASYFYGFSTDEFAQMTIKDLRPNEDKKMPSTLPATPLEDRRRHTRISKHQRKDGSVLDVEISSYRMDFDGRPGRLVLSIDVSDRLRVEETIRSINESLEEKVKERTIELAAVNKELESFAYSVSHDLRAPLRSIDGFSLAVLEIHADRLNDEAVSYLSRVRRASQRMSQLIEDLLMLSRVSRGELTRINFDLTEIAEQIFHTLQENEPDRKVTVKVKNGMKANGDQRLLRIALENLIGNAWKFTSKNSEAVIEIGFRPETFEYFVGDNGAGFNMAYADELFGPFQRLHRADEFEGTGIGLATVQRIIHRHGGTIRAESELDKGATFYFSLGK